MCSLSLLLYIVSYSHFYFFFFFNDTATTEIYTLSLHDALPISWPLLVLLLLGLAHLCFPYLRREVHLVESVGHQGERSEEHTSELQSPCNLVCRLLLEKKKNTNIHLATASSCTA